MILITGGCSFSECISPWIETWPKHLESALRPQHSFHDGLGCQGNGMISRELIYRVTETLKEHSAEELLVGIMWSGPDRHEIFLNYNELTEKINHGMAIPGENGLNLGVFNPHNWIANVNNGWLILDKSRDADIRSAAWYKHMHNWAQSQIFTIEHILRVQWFLKMHDIRYFMTTYTGEVFNERLIQTPNVKYLYEQIDFEHFLPVTGEFEWCRDFSNLDFPVKGDNHPSSSQHKLFVEQVIMPFLKSKSYS